MASVAVAELASKVRTFCTPHPRRNLPIVSSRRRAENQFSRAFQRAFVASQKSQGVGGHEFEANGYGIADFVWAAFATTRSLTVSRTSEPFLGKTKLMALEMKLNDWSRAIQQAYRYTYFADQSIVVLPTTAAKVARRQLALLREMRVGLWGFDKCNGQIVKYFTPRTHCPRNPAARDRALDLLCRRFDLCRPPKDL